MVDIVTDGVQRHHPLTEAPGDHLPVLGFHNAGDKIGGEDRSVIP